MGNSSSSHFQGRNGTVTEYWIKDDIVKRESLPAEVDLRYSSCFPYPTIKDQGSEGSCVSFAMNSAYLCAQRKQNIPVVKTNVQVAQELFDKARQKSNVQRPESSGLTFSEAMKSLEGNATWFRLGKTTENFRKCLALGYPIVFGFGMTQEMYDWQLDKNGAIQKTNYVMPIPQSPDSTHITAFHCILIIGYQNGFFVCRNSWGNDWGEDGHFYLPFSVMKNPKITLDAMIVDVKT